MRLIKDPIHGNIPYSILEEKFFATPVFNRLHNIRQNSMAYTVYPALQTRRFIHSIGVMHIATEIFFHSLVNADKQVFHNYIEKKKDFFSAKIKNKDWKPFLDKCRNLEAPDIEQCINERNNLKKSVYWRNVLDNIVGPDFVRLFSFRREVFAGNEDNFYAFVIMLQALRIYALSHDLGHLPMSHLSEYAINSFLKYSDESQIKKIKHVRPIIEENFENKKLLTEISKLHEPLSIILRQSLFQTIISNEAEQMNKRGISAADRKIHIINISFLTFLENDVMGEINPEGELSCLYHIIASDLDADRMDFVFRDGTQSGFLTGSGDSQRVLKQFSLVETHDGSQQAFEFLPAIQSLTDIQQILIDRYKVYKHIVGHHKVVKMDYFVQKSVELLLVNALKNKKGMKEYEKRMREARIHIDSIIDLFPTILAEGVYFPYTMAQLTDDWLMNILRERFYRFEKDPSNVQKDYQGKLLHNMLKEVFTSTKRYRPLWKRDYEYAEALKETFGIAENDFFTALENNQDNIETLLSGLCDDDALPVRDEEITFEFINKLLFSLRVKGGLTYVEKAINDKFNEHVVFIAPAKTKTGVDSLKLVDIKNLSLPPKKFAEVSSVPDFLKKDFFSGMQFYLFYDTGEDGREKVNRKQILDYLGHCIIKSFIEF